MRHGPAMPAVPASDELSPASSAQTLPGAEPRTVPGEPVLVDVPVEMAWHRFERPLESPAADQAVLVWATCGYLIGLVM
jgi:hypothetical protein